jgi:hypothetical protein
VPEARWHLVDTNVLSNRRDAEGDPGVATGGEHPIATLMRQ